MYLVQEQSVMAGWGVQIGLYRRAGQTDTNAEHGAQLRKAPLCAYGSLKMPPHSSALSIFETIGPQIP